MPTDFYSPFMSAVIVNGEDGARYPLWTDLEGISGFQAGLAGSVSGRQAVDSDEYTPRALAYVTDITVELDLGLIPRITVQLSPPLEEAQRILNSRVIEWAQSTIEVELGYTSGGEVVLGGPFVGLIQQPQVTLGAQASITIEAQGVGGFDIDRRKSTTTLEGTRQDIITRILRGPNPKRPRRVEVDDSPVRNALYNQPVPQTFLNTSESVLKAFGQGTTADNVTGTLQPLANRNSPYWRRYFNEVIQVSQGGVSDWVMIWRLVREARCMMRLEENKLVAFPVATWLTDAPRRALRFFHYPSSDVSPVNGVLPIINASSNMPEIYLPNAIWGYRASDISSKKGTEVTEIRGDSETKTARTDDGDTTRPLDEHDSGPDEDSGDGLDAWSGSPEDPETQARVDSAYEAMSSKLGLQMEIETLMDPDVSPGTVVSIDGISARHDGNYAVLSVVYNIGSGGATMTLTVISNIGQLASRGASGPTVDNSENSFGTSGFDTERATTRPSGPINPGLTLKLTKSGIPVPVDYNVTEQTKTSLGSIRKVFGV